MKMSIVFVIALLGICALQPDNCNVRPNRVDTLRLLTGSGQKYWDPHFTNEKKIIGVGWIFSTDKSFREFEYAPKSKRRIFTPDFNLYMEMDRYRFSLSGDTLVLSIYNDYRFKILKINEDTLQVENIDNYGNGNNRLLFTKSEDQKTKPIFLNLNPDSLMKEFGP